MIQIKVKAIPPQPRNKKWLGGAGGGAGGGVIATIGGSAGNSVAELTAEPYTTTFYDI